MDILKELYQSGRKIVVDTKSPKNTTGVSKKVSDKAAPKEQITDIHEAFVKRVVKDKPPKKDLVEFFERVCDAEEKKL
jgi:predicted hydrocarbon binding protein